MADTPVPRTLRSSPPPARTQPMEVPTSRLLAVVGPLADAAGVDLVDVALKGSGPARLLRVTVARKGGVGLQTCQDLSRAVSAALDAEDVIDGRYTLEVTTPGTDHPLRDRRDFDRVEGLGVLVHRRTSEDAPVEQVRGTVREAEDDAVVLDVDGGPVRIPYAEIAKATQTLPW